MSIKKIACSTDFSENSEIAFAAALEAAEKYDASLDVLHVLPHSINPMISEFGMLPMGDSLAENSDEFHQSLVNQMREKMEENFGERVKHLKESRLVILDGHVSTEIISYLKEKDIDLVIMGSYGYSGMGLVLFGSVAKRVAHKAHCSVVIARAKNIAV